MAQCLLFPAVIMIMDEGALWPEDIYGVILLTRFLQSDTIHKQLNFIYMSDITLKDIGSLLDKKLKPLETKISGIETKVSGIETKISGIDAKADRTSVLVANLVEDFHGIPATLKSITETLNSHTAVLEQLLTEKKNREEEKIASTNRFDRLERWAVLAGEKLGIKLEL